MERIARHAQAIRNINSEAATESDSGSADVLVSALTNITGGILDSGAARHVEPSKDRFSSLTDCSPITLLDL